MAMDGGIGINRRKTVRLDTAIAWCSQWFHGGVAVKLRNDMAVRQHNTEGSEIGGDANEGGACSGGSRMVGTLGCRGCRAYYKSIFTVGKGVGCIGRD